MSCDYERYPTLAEFVHDPEKFTLLYQKDGCLYELIDNQQLLYPSSTMRRGGEGGGEGRGGEGEEEGEGRGRRKGRG